MDAPQDPRQAALDRIRGRVRGLRAELDALERELDEYSHAQAGRSQPPHPAARQHPAAMPYPGAVPYVPVQRMPAPIGRPVQPPRPRPAPGPAWHERDGAVAQILAMVGAFVLLIGVVLLLLGGNAGVLPPVVAGIIAVVVSVAMVGFGMALPPLPATTPDQRAERQNPGAVALMGVGLAGLLLTVWASATLFDWVSDPVGLGLGAAVALAGMLLARLRNSESLNVLVVLGTSLLGYLVSGAQWEVGAAFCVALLLASLLFHDRRREWPVAQVARAAVAPWGLMLPPADDQRLLVFGAALVLAGVGIASVLWLAPRRPQSLVPLVGLVAGALPWVAGVLPPDRGVLPGSLQVVVIAALVAASLFATRATRWPVVSLLVAAGMILLRFDARLELTDGMVIAMAFALVLAVWALAARRDDLMTAAAIVASVAAFLMMAWVPFVLSRRTSEHLEWWNLATSLLLLVLVGLQVTWWSRRTGTASRRAVVRAISMLVPFTIACVVAGTLLGRLVERPDSGFVAGHVIATMAWAGVGTWLLLRVRQRSEDPRGIFRLGILLVALALAKLFLFDLASLDGIFRVIAFFGVGLLLVGIGVRYGRTDQPRR